MSNNQNYTEKMNSTKSTTETFDLENDQYIETPWNIIESYFRGQHLERLVRHQLESYNNFVGYQISKTIEMFNPVHIVSEQDYDPNNKKYSLETFITFENFHIYRPQIHENNGAIKLMFPQEARLRNFTYASSMTVDVNIKYIVRSGAELESTQIFYKTLPNIHIGKLPIMLKSNICVLNQYKHFENVQTGECKFDAGGYFIINGSEKTVLGQERAAENKVYCFNVSKNNTKYTWIAEIKSVPDFKCISPKQINMMISSKNNGFGNPLFVQIPRVKQPIPLFIVFRALGVISDKEICEKVLLDITNNENKKLLDALQASIIDANKYLSKEDCIKYITGHAMYTPINMDRETGAKKKLEFTMDILNNDLFPHCQNSTQKIYFLGYMTNKLLQANFEMIKQDDRDSFLNKRIDLTGTLLNNLFRNYFNKLVKDMEKQVIREINTGSWKSKDDYENIINFTNICKIIKSTTIENGLKRALATGDFGIKHTNSNKVGVAQVLNRLTYVSSLSHARRISTPTDKSGKLIPPRKLHNTSWGMICPAETPEGQSVGIVKNLSYMTHITIHSNSLSLYDYIMPNIINISDINISTELHNKVKVFINGAWVGITNEPENLYNSLKEKKYKGIINIYTSIIFDYRNKELRVCNDGGRLMRPLLRVKNSNVLITDSLIKKLKSNELNWDNLLIGYDNNESVIEYIDSDEQSWSMIATKPKDLIQKGDRIYKYTHCEIHPSTIFGVLASCIPFPEHNQSPRNCYQCAQGKQAMGVYVTNYENRMDKTAYVLNYPSRPLVDTRVMNLIQLNKIPSGTNVVVAIMTHTGYNQEDSLLFNKGSIDRGLFVTTIYHTEKDEDKQKINGDEEIRCKPDPAKTKGMKFGNYNKVNSKGVIPENTLVENRDIIIAKVTPIKENRNDHTKVIKFEDQSRIHRTVEETYVDKNYIDRNGEGYNFAKVRLRIVRKPVIGDKFCMTSDHDVLTLNRGWIPINEVKDSDLIGQLNRTNNTLEYVKPLEILEFEHIGKMYNVETQGISQCVTLNHRMWIQKRDKKDYQLIPAEEMIGKRVRFQSGSSPVNNPDLEIKINDDIYTGEKCDAFLILFGIFIAEGWTYINEKDYICRIEYAANKPRVQEQLKKSCEILNVNYSMNKNSFKWYINNKNLTHEFQKYSVGAVNKYLPEWYTSLSERQTKILLYALCLGDGHETATSLHYYTSSIKLRDNIQILAQHAGYTAYYTSRYEAGCSSVMKDGRIITTTATAWDIGIRKKRLFPTLNHGHKHEQNGQIEEVFDYQGKVYCLRVPSEVFLVRRNGKCSFTGNSSRHGQKGTIGNIIPEADMPFTASGVKPDIIINPHAIPSRMTIGQLKETVLGKVLVELGLFGDGTSFGQFEVKDICDELIKLGYEAHGNELLHNGLTGEQVECSVFMGPVFYQRLKHMVNDKAHSRSIGPMVNLTRQPAEGRSRDGGLRFGEMEKDAMVSHGAARFTRGRMYDASDKYSVHVCKKCGLVAAYNDEMQIHHCRVCDNRTDFAYVEIPYACKLLCQELNTMNIAPRFITDN
jgi:DNA-directed RNA polymerase II subunit RPB2